MRGRIAFIIILAIVAAVLAVQNWPEVTRTSQLTVGIVQTSLPLGLILLSLLAITLAVFLVSAATQESRHLMEHRRNARALQAQRELAEKAEASRYTDLRQQLDTHLRETRQRETIVTTEFEKTVMQSQRELRAQIEQMNHMLSTRLADLESRLGGRPLPVEPLAPDVTRAPDLTTPVDVPPRDRIRTY